MLGLLCTVQFHGCFFFFSSSNRKVCPITLCRLCLPLLRLCTNFCDSFLFFMWVAVFCTYVFSVPSFFFSLRAKALQRVGLTSAIFFCPSQFRSVSHACEKGELVSNPARLPCHVARVKGRAFFGVK